jgi:hypothetical protein
MWKAIPGYEGLYEVSDDGCVRGLKRGKALRPGHNKQGRLQVVLCKDGITSRRQVHGLVLRAFVGPPNGLECRHLDGNHLNNALYNLCWGTHLENMRDKKAHGTHRAGQEHPRAKLTWEQVSDIRSSKLDSSYLARQYGVSQPAISNVRLGKTYKSVGCG